MRSIRALGLLVVLGLSACTASSPDAAIEEGEDDVRAASTTLTFALVGREYDQSAEEWKSVELDSLNPKLEAAGLPPFAKSITAGAKDSAKLEALRAELEAANAKLGREIEFFQDWDPSGYVGLCYTGVPSGVVKTVEGLRGTAFPEYMGMPAYHYKRTKRFLYGMDEAEFFDMHREDNGDVVDAWERFDTSSDAFMMLADGGQQGDGTELFAVSIPKCR